MKNINTKIEAKTPISKLSAHPDNPRRGDVELIGKSVDANGFYGTIVAQLSTGRILSGNHRYQAAVAAGAKTLPVAWVDVDDAKAREILLADNRTSDVAVYDDAALADLLAQVSEDGGLDATGYSSDDLDDLLREIQLGEPEPNSYTQTVESPIYEPEGDRPPVAALYDQTTARELELSISEADLPEDLRAFLLAAAARHVRFDYQTIANYYAHAPAAVQSLMEASALVIIDYGQAIERGFVRLHESVAATFLEDHPDA